MSQVSKQVLQSIEGEIRALVESAVVHLSANEPESIISLNSLLVEINGVCAMLELSGGQRLIQEMKAVLASEVGASSGSAGDTSDANSPDTNSPDASSANGTGMGTAEKQVLQKSLELLPDYVHYASGLPWEGPCLLLPEIIALRRLQGKPPLYEYQLLPNEWLANTRLQGINPLNSEDLEALKRLRHLYQLGLLDVIQNRNRAKALSLLARAASRIKRLFSSASETYYWSLVESLLSALAQNQLEIRPERLRLLSAVERQLNLLANPDKRGDKNPYPLGLWGALGGLVALTPVANEVDARMREWIGLPQPNFSDLDTMELRRLLHKETPEALSNALREIEERVSSLHDLLEMLDEQSTLVDSETRLFVGLSQGIADHCSSIGLKTAAARFREHAKLFSQPEPIAELESANQAGSIEQDDLSSSAGEVDSEVQRPRIPQEVAESLLYLEALLAVIGADSSPRSLIELNLQPVNRVIQANLLRSAEKAVWDEAGIKLVAAKNMIDDFMAGLSQDDIIPQLAALFDGLRGSARLLDETRVVDITWRCRDFVAEKLAFGQADNRQLGLFADAIISLEYYLDCCAQGQPSEQRSLDMADDYLTRLDS